MTTIKLHSGQDVLIDEDDFEKIKQYKWYMGTAGYAVTVKHRKGASRKDKNKNINISMHRLIMGFPKNYIIDHINGNRLDNRKSNLRLVNHVENANNINVPVKNKLNLVGVRKQSNNCYEARHSTKTIGFYKTAEEAALARDIYVKLNIGPHARYNFDYSSLPDNLPKSNEPKNTGVRTSKIKNVSLSKTRRAKDKWRVVINKKHLGWFLTESEAIAFKESYLESK